MLESGQGTPTVVYFHCDAGMDRTGEMYGDYMMTCVTPPVRLSVCPSVRRCGRPPAGCAWHYEPRQFTQCRC
jgi:hypothetical protein